jgi:hypothetical protein
LPFHGYQWGGKNDHTNDGNGTEYQREPETFENPRNLDEEVGPLHLFRRRTPGDVVREQVREKSNRKMNAKAAEKEEAAGQKVKAAQKERGRNTYKNGIQIKFSIKEDMILRWPSLYSNSVYAKFPAPGNTTWRINIRTLDTVETC